MNAIGKFILFVVILIALCLLLVYFAADVVQSARRKGDERAADVNAWHCHDWQDCQ